MANEYDDIYDLENLSDTELKDLILQELGEHPELDVDLIEVHVTGGAVRLAGRVGTEAEVSIAEQVLTDVIGLDSVTTELVVDGLVRGQRSEAADEAYVEELEADPQFAVGAGNSNTSDTAQHLVEDLEAEHFGTHNMQEAVERGTAYEPADRPIQQGNTSRENH